MDQYQEIHRHYEQTSLFLETLLRRSHFEKGHYVVDLKPVNLRAQVVKPQLERYRGRLEDKGVRIEAGPGTESVRDPMVLADVGLISQVVANFFSNAAKYTRPAPRGADRPGESFVIYDWDEVERVGDREMPAVRFSVLTSGEPLADEEAGQLFTDGFRGRNASQEYGTGHGLSFVREVVGLHRGVAGYEPAPSGNLFFFYLPQPDEGESV
jgi:signal transduction histidine kinase